MTQIKTIKFTDYELQQMEKEMTLTDETNFSNFSLKNLGFLRCFYPIMIYLTLLEIKFWS